MAPKKDHENLMNGDQSSAGTHFGSSMGANSLKVIAHLSAYQVQQCYSQWGLQGIFTASRLATMSLDLVTAAVWQPHLKVDGAYWTPREMQELRSS